MKWTTETPMVAGYYWWRSPTDRTRCGIIEVTERFGELVDAEDNWHTVKRMGGEWVGPIPAPEE